AKLLPGAGGRAGLFHELALRGQRWRLGGLELPRRQCPDPTADGMAKLTQQTDAIGVVDCHDCRTTRMTDNLEIGYVSVGQADGLDIDSNDPTFEHRAYLQRAHKREPSGLRRRTLPEMSQVRD